MKNLISNSNLLYTHSKTQSPKKTDFVNHNHIQYELFYFLSGNAYYVMGNLSHKLEPMDLILVPPLSNHYVQLCGSEDYERIVIDFYSCDISSKILEDLFSVPKMINIQSNEYILNIFNRFDYYSTVFLGENRNIVLNNLLIELLYLLSINLQDSSLSFFSGCSSSLNNILQYVNNHLFEINDLDTICNQFYISRPYLHKLFRNAFMISPMKYITNRRLILARELIHVGEKPSRVYLKVGFNDYSAFFRAYKSFFNCSPNQDKPDSTWIHNDES